MFLIVLAFEFRGQSIAWNSIGLSDDTLDGDNFVMENSKTPEDMKIVMKSSKEDIQAELEKAR